MEQLELKLDGIPFTVWFYWTSPKSNGDYLTPDDKGEIDLQEVYNGDDNIIEYLSQKTIEKLTELAIEKMLDK